MPLPIGDATATPGSPIIGPEDSYMGSVAPDHLLDEHHQSRQSAVSGATVDDDEALDELQPYTPSGVGRAVPTLIEWTAPGDKVYVTGTFVNWEKKFRLHRRYAMLPHPLSHMSRRITCYLGCCTLLELTGTLHKQ